MQRVPRRAVSVAPVITRGTTVAHNTPVSRFVHQFFLRSHTPSNQMGCGASHAEITEGSAVTGRWDQKLVMPPGVAAEAIAGGMKPGKALKNFTPTRVQALLIKRSARKLYDEFESEIAADCGGNSWSGWDSKKIYDKVGKFQDRFNEKGIRVCYHMVTWQQWQSNGQYGGHMQIHYRYWMTYSDIEMAGGTPGDAFDPEIDYEKTAPKDKPKTKSEDMVEEPLDD